MKPLTTFNDFWFRPSSPLPLAVCRILFFGWLFLWYLNFDFTAIAYYPPEIWRPMQVLKAAQLDFIPTAGTLAVLQIVWKASLLLACVGLFTRPSLAVAAGLGGYLLALTHSFSKINHSDGLLVVTFAVLAFSHAHHALSLDRLWQRRRSPAAPAESGEYTWPFQAVRLAVVLLFFGSGLSKLLVGGWAWMFSDNLANIVAGCQLTREPFLHLPIDWIPFYVALAAGTVVIELAAPLALFHRRSRALIIPSLLAMQIGIRLVMGDNFTQFMAIYLFWLPWTPLLAYVRSWRERRAVRELPVGGRAVAAGLRLAK